MSRKRKQAKPKRKPARKVHPLAPRLAELVQSAVAAASTWSQTRSAADKLAARNAIVTAIGLFQQADGCSVIDARSSVVSWMAMVIVNDKPQYTQGAVYRQIAEKILGSEMPVEDMFSVVPAIDIVHAGFDFSAAVNAAMRFFEHVVASPDADTDDAVAHEAAAAVVAGEVMAVANKIAAEGKVSRGDAAGAAWHAITVTLATYHGVSQLDVLTVLVDIQRAMPDAYQNSDTKS